jgi:bla regulator protein blaR1
MNNFFPVFYPGMAKMAEHAILFAIIIFLRPLIRRYCGSKWVEFLWLTLLARILFFGIDNTFSILSLIRSLLNKVDIPPFQHLSAISQTASHEAAENIKDIIKITSHNQAAPPTIKKAAVLLRNSVSGIFILFTGFSYFRFLHLIKQRARKVIRPDIAEKIEKIKKQIKVKDKITIHIAEDRSPLLYGLRNYKILVPRIILEEEMDHLESVLLHEISHAKRKDNWKLLLLSISRSLFWYNPIVHLLSVEWHRDIELACDEHVLKFKGKQFLSSYVETLINLGRFTLVRNAGSKTYFAQMSSTISLKKRILHICHSDLKKNFTSVFLKLLFPLLLLNIISGSLFGTGQEPLKYDIVHMNSDAEGYQIALWDNTGEEFLVNGKEAATENHAAVSLIKIPVSLALLESETITIGDSILPWDGSRQPYKLWEQDQDLSSALAYSVNWYFLQEIRIIGSGYMQDFLRTLDYGRKRGPIRTESDFLSQIETTPLAQTYFMERFLSRKLDCSVENQKHLKNLLYQGTYQGYKVYGKTGSALDQTGTTSGWFSGFAERGDNRIAFSFYHPHRDGNEIKHYVIGLFENASIEKDVSTHGP